MGKVFFPGGIQSKQENDFNDEMEDEFDEEQDNEIEEGLNNSYREDQDSHRSMWREREFMFFLFKMAVMPVMQLKECIEKWHRISQKLREPQRKRRLQIDRRSEVLPGFS